MAANTGPDENTYQIPDVLLGDTFNVWKDITNTSVYKLNKINVYKGVSSDCLEAQTTSNGDLTYILVPNIMTGHTFTSRIEFDGGVQFDSGVTFNGPVVFNAPTFTVNANTVTIDDYNILLGDTGGASDSNISVVGGGGIILNRGGGLSADWLWNPTALYGLTGIWAGEGHIGFKGASAGIRPHGGTNLLVHGTGLRIDGAAGTEHGVQISLAGSGTTTGRTIEFSRYSPSGSTAFVDVELRTPPSAAGSRPYMNIKDGANRKTIRKVTHSFPVGTPLTINSSGVYVAAQANSPSNAEVVGVVSRVFDGDNFEITFLGEIFDVNFSQITIEGTSGVTGSVYYLSPFVAGKLTVAVPQTVNSVHKAVMIATSGNSAIVLPWTGGVLSETVTLAESTSNTILISQLNQFKPGDVVQFVARTNGVTLTYGSNQAYYPFGSYARADALNESSTFNIAGMVVSTTELSAGSTFNRAFNLMMDGFFSVPGGVSVMNGGAAGALVAGRNYFLGGGITGNGPSLEGVTSSLTDTAPTAVGAVNKPVLLATSPTSGYVYSYRGAVGNVVIPPTEVALANMLITDIRTSTAQNLVFNVSNSGTRYQVMEFDSTSGGLGNIRVGTSAFISTSPGAGATLSVAGTIAAGDGAADSGSSILCSRFGGALPQTLNVFGSQQSTGNTVVSYGVRPLVGSQGYSSTTASSRPRSALEVGTGQGGDVDRPILRFLGANTSATAVGSTVTLTELMKVTGSTATFAVPVVSSSGFIGPVTGSVTGNASTATTLQTQRTITLSGDVTGSVGFNGGSDVTLSTALAAGSIVNADIADGTITDAKLATLTTAGKVANSATSASNLNNVNTLVLRNGSDGGFESGLISCTLTPSTVDHLTRKGYVDTAVSRGMVINQIDGVVNALPLQNNTNRVTVNLPAAVPSNASYVMITIRGTSISTDFRFGPLTTVSTGTTIRTMSAVAGGQVKGIIPIHHVDASTKRIYFNTIANPGTSPGNITIDVNGWII